MQLDVVESRMRAVRGSFMASKNKMKMWQQQPSGSGRQRSKTSKAYKFAAELGEFLNPVLKSKPTRDNIDDSLIMVLLYNLLFINAH